MREGVPMSDDSGSLKEPVGLPPGVFLEVPNPSVPGEILPPMATSFSVGLTGKDAKGHRWAILRGDDGTVAASFRIPWQVAAQWGAGIAQGLAAVAAQAEREQTGGLVVPGRGPGGVPGLFLPSPNGGGPRGG
jgi:hypothetical protein